jgi:hypothetical protein
MRVLLVSTLVYMVGVVTVYYVRPALMFDSQGRWKEFGLGGAAANTTPFPVWAFCILWAILSYLVVKLLVPEESNPVNVAALSALSSMLSDQPSGVQRLKPSALPETVIEPLPTPTKSARMVSPNKKQDGGASRGKGYYKLKKGKDGNDYFKFVGSKLLAEDSESSEEEN